MLSKQVPGCVQEILEYEASTLHRFWQNSIDLTESVVTRGNHNFKTVTVHQRNVEMSE